MNAVAIIPARFGSTRLPGKPLLNRTGRCLIQHVYERAAAARCVGRCVVATDDERIAAAVRSFGGQAVMTRADHVSGTDRLAEAATIIGTRDDELILNVQGDEPELEPACLDRLVERMAADAACPLGTLACPFPPEADPADPNCVKVVRNLAGRALYFSRALVPYRRDGGKNALAAPVADRRHADAPAATRRHGPWLLHLGVYAYRRNFLAEFASWPPSPLEQLEKLEQLRALERGVAIAVELVERAAVGIDTPEDYEQFVLRWIAQHGRS